MRSIASHHRPEPVRFDIPVPREVREAAEDLRKSEEW